MALTREFFRNIARTFQGNNSTRAVVITHLVNGRELFIDALNEVVEVGVIIPKPSSINQATLQKVSSRYRVERFSRHELSNLQTAERVLNDASTVAPLVVLDIGGYFAPAADSLKLALGERFLGIVEDTENGHQKYQTHDTQSVPVFSAARSPLKETEDHLVGESIVHSAEHLLRGQDVLTKGKHCAVIGFGKVGRSIAYMLRNRGSNVRVYDRDPLKMVLAESHGFQTNSNKRLLLSNSQIVFCATGSEALSGTDYYSLRPGAFVSSVTSADDELDLAFLRQHFRSKEVGEHVSLLRSGKSFFHLLSNGNAVNFLHGASVGPHIALVQAELLAASALLSRGPGNAVNGLSELDGQARKLIANEWLKIFSHNALKTQNGRNERCVGIPL